MNSSKYSACLFAGTSNIHNLARYTTTPPETRCEKAKRLSALAINNNIKDI